MDLFRLENSLVSAKPLDLSRIQLFLGFFFSYYYHFFLDYYPEVVAVNGDVGGREQQLLLGLGLNRNSRQTHITAWPVVMVVRAVMVASFPFPIIQYNTECAFPFRSSSLRAFQLPSKIIKLQ